MDLKALVDKTMGDREVLNRHSIYALVERAYRAGKHDYSEDLKSFINVEEHLIGRRDQ